MAVELTRYTFLIKEDGWAVDDPHHHRWVRTFTADAQAEAFAKRLSEDHRGAWVTIKRPDASWQVKDFVHREGG
jgi:CYTH domain-containing protein